MKSIEERMSGYAAYHQNYWCRATHFLGVPMVYYAPLIALGWLRFNVGPVEISLAVIVFAAMMIWYFATDWQLATVMTLISLPIVYATELAAQLPFEQSLAIFLAVKLGGWVIQLVGHVFEGRRPALVDNFLQALMAPLFLIAEVQFALGFRKKLEADVEERVARHRFPEQIAKEA